MTAYRWRDPARRRLPQYSTGARVARAIASPDTVTGRRQHETMAAWQARAVLDVIVSAVREGREPFAGVWDDAVAEGAQAERERLKAEMPTVMIKVDGVISETEWNALGEKLKAAWREWRDAP